MAVFLGEWRRQRRWHHKNVEARRRGHLLHVKKKKGNNVRHHLTRALVFMHQTIPDAASMATAKICAVVYAVYASLKLYKEMPCLFASHAPPVMRSEGGAAPNPSVTVTRGLPALPVSYFAHAWRQMPSIFHCWKNDMGGSSHTDRCSFY